jgi:hypothetical protein
MAGDRRTPTDLVEQRTILLDRQVPRSQRLRQILIGVPDRTPHPTTATYGLGEPAGDDGWRWRDSEVLRLESLLAEGGLGSGPAPTDPAGDSSQELLALLRTGDGVNQQALQRLITAMVTTTGLAEAVAELEVAGRLSTLIEQAHRQKGLSRLVESIDNPASKGADLRQIIADESWVFGGRYVPPFAIERIPELTGGSLPLVRTDGALHLIEVGPANVPDLIIASGRPAEPSREVRYGVGAEIQAAVNRVIDQLRLVDELAGAVRETLGVETRRAMATVLIGHRSYLAGDAARDALRTTLRTYSSHLVGLEVISYDELVYNAERALASDRPAATVDAES